MKPFKRVQVGVCSGRSAPQLEVSRKMAPQTLASTSKAEVRDWIMFLVGRVPASWLDAITGSHALV